MKVLHVVPSIEQSYGGPTRSLAGYLAASVRSGVEAHVAAPRSTVDDAGNLEKHGAAKVNIFDSTGSGGLARSPSLVRWVSANASGFDLVHVHGLFNFISSLSSRAAIRSGAPLVIRPFGTLSRYTFTHRRGMLKRVWFSSLEKPSLLGASGVHFTTAHERDEATWHNLPLAGKAHVIPPPYLEDHEHPAEAESSSPAARGTVLFVGRIHPIKNLEALIDAWPALLRAHPTMQLVIAGSGVAAYEQALRQRVNQLGMNGSVTFAGFLSPSERDLALARAAVFVLPSHHENFGMAALEAIAAGVPVVFSPHVQLRDFVVENNLGVVTEGSPSHMADAISQILSNTALRTRVAASGKEIVEKSYSTETIGMKLRAMYLAVLEEHRNRKPKTVI